MKARKRVLSVVLILICVAAMTVSFAACDGFSSSEKDPDAFYQDSKIKLTDMSYDKSYSDIFNNYELTIYGKAVNMSKKDYSRMYLSFTIYDADKNILTTTNASIFTTVKSGQAWSFSTLTCYTSVEPMSYGFNDYSVH